MDDQVVGPDPNATGDPYHPAPLQQTTMAPPRLGQRYGLMPLLRSHAQETASGGRIVPDHGPGPYAGGAAPVLEPPQQFTEHERQAPISETAETMANAGVGNVAGELFTAQGALLNILDALRDLKPREPIDVSVFFGQGVGGANTYAVPGVLRRNGRRHIILWGTSPALQVVLSGVLPQTNLTLKIGWNVLDVPDGTTINLQTPTTTGVTTYYRCQDDVPAGLINN